MPESMVLLFIVVFALIFLVILTFLYRLTLAIGRLEKRLEYLGRHLWEANLYELGPEPAVFGLETELESVSEDGRSDSDTRSPFDTTGGTTPRVGPKPSANSEITPAGAP